MSANLLQGIAPDGTIKAIAVNPDGSIPVSGSPGGGSGDASATNQLTEIDRFNTILETIGLKGDDAETPSLIEGDNYQGQAPYSIVTVLKSTNVLLARLFSATITTVNRQSNSTENYSGQITEANVSQLVTNNLVGTVKTSFIFQNLVISGVPSNDLWLGFGRQAEINSGCIQVKAGETFELTGASIPNQLLFVIGSQVGQKFTCIVGIIY